jgi:hypothetical protein
MDAPINTGPDEPLDETLNEDLDEVLDENVQHDLTYTQRSTHPEDDALVPMTKDQLGKKEIKAFLEG